MPCARINHIPGRRLSPESYANVNMAPVRESCTLVGVLTDQSLFAWCESALGGRPAEVILRTGHLSRVLVVALPDGRHIAVKARPFEPAGRLGRRSVGTAVQCQEGGRGGRGTATRPALR